MLRKFLHGLTNVLFKLLSKVEVYGLENVPEQGNGILVTNHIGSVDAPLVFTVIKREDITALVAKKHQKNPILRILFNAAGGIWLNREEADTHAMREVMQRLQDGWLIGIAPEGTRSKTGAMIRAKTGVAYLADRASVPVIPAGITGTYRARWGLLRLKRPHITIRFGEPFYLSPVDRKHRDEDLRRNTDEIMCRIALLIPPQYWGVYAESPQLKRLLEAQESCEEVAITI
jgi:1-acyl-sn-glycerol-3-phosphate acyltransferase